MILCTGATGFIGVHTVRALLDASEQVVSVHYGDTAGARERSLKLVGVSLERPTILGRHALPMQERSRRRTTRLAFGKL